VPKRIVFPELFDLFHKMGVFFPFLRFNDCKTRTRCRITCFPAAGTELMTDLLTTAGESVFVFARLQAE